MMWVIGGTKDSREFIEKFPKKSLLIATTATEYGEELIKGYGIKSLAKKMDYEEIKDFVRDENIKLIVDLSHPYAKEISSNAIQISKEMNLSYVRYERGEIQLGEKNCFPTPEEIAIYLENLQENILITLGSNSIEKFKNLKNLSNIYFRVLPTVEVIEKCRYFGISPKNIFAVQGPFSENMNRAIIEEYNIKYLVTKQSGETGGEREKVEACRKSGVKIIYLEKPKISYEIVFECIDEMISEILKREMR